MKVKTKRNKKSSTTLKNSEIPLKGDMSKGSLNKKKNMKTLEVNLQNWLTNLAKTAKKVERNFNNSLKLNTLNYWIW